MASNASGLKEGFELRRALNIVVSGAAQRGIRLVTKPVVRVFALHHLLQQIPGTFAEYIDLYGNDTNKASYNNFVASNVPPEQPAEDVLVAADKHNFMATSMDYWTWVERARQIRSAGPREYCVGNLSVALNVGAAYASGMSSANTLLSLIPTAGVLIGPQAKELWVLYKLCPLAGMLSILLSLGGSIIPMDLNDYEKLDAFQYQGMVATADDTVFDREGDGPAKTEAERFADQVLHRARNPNASRPTMSITGGMLLQVCAIAAILIACWFLESGAILVWWCEAYYWMFIWYVMVAFSSILENFAGVPFTRTHTIRVWRAPRVRIDEDSPWVISPPQREAQDFSENHEVDDLLQNPDGSQIPRRPVPQGKTFSGSHGIFSAGSSANEFNLSKRPTAMQLQKEAFSDPVDVLTKLEKGYSNMSRIWMDPSEPWSQSDDAFYVLLSVKGVSHLHAALRVLSKIISIGVFAIGTAFFASATLITILEAMTAATLILCAGIFGRVTAMWMASTMMRHKPVLHRIVKNREEASKYLEDIFRKDEIACEVKGHIIIQGRCIKRFGKRLRWSSFLGVLARPYNLTKMAVNGGAAIRMANQDRWDDGYGRHV